MTKTVLMSAPRFYGIDEAIRDAFKSMGFNVQLVLTNPQISFLERVARRWKLKPVIRYYLDRENQEFLNIVKRVNPDILFIIKGEHLFPETLRRIKLVTKAPLLAYIWDDPFFSYAGAFYDDYRKTNFERGMGLYDRIFVYDTFYAQQIRDRGVKHVDYLPLAADPRWCATPKITQEEKERYGHDLCFVGYPYPNRVDVLDQLSQYDLGVYGEGWEQYFAKQGRDIPSYYKGKASGEMVQKIYMSSKIVLNIHDPEAQEGLNTRAFDILASGAFELVDYKKNVDLHFKVGEEIIVFRDQKDLLRQIDYFLAHKAEAQRIASLGKERVLAEHTWTHRVMTVMNMVNEGSS